MRLLSRAKRPGAGEHFSAAPGWSGTAVCGYVDEEDEEDLPDLVPGNESDDEPVPTLADMRRGVPSTSTTAPASSMAAQLLQAAREIDARDEAHGCRASLSRPFQAQAGECG